MHIPEWWKDVNDDLEDGCDHAYSCYWYYICGVYGIVAAVALAQLIRIHHNVPNFNWTIQKAFHLLNFIICLIRALTFGFHEYMDDLQDATSIAVQLFIFDIAGLLFFTTYTLLVLFWAEIYHQALDDDTTKLKQYFYGINIVVYIVQIILWLITIQDDAKKVARAISAGWMTFVFLCAVAGFIAYGGLLHNMLSKFPIDSTGRKKKLMEVGVISTVCSCCFAARSVIVFMYILDKSDFDLDMMQDALLNIVFYFGCEIFPAASILFVLRKIHSKPRRPQLEEYAVLGTQDE